MSIRRAKPRKIGLPESDSEPESSTPSIKTSSPKPKSSPSPSISTPGTDDTPIPTFSKRTSKKTSRISKPTLSLDQDPTEDGEEEPPVFIKKPLRKKPTTASQSLHKSALANATASTTGTIPKKPPPMRISMPDRPLLAGAGRAEEDRPSYSKEYLAELKASTPTATPEVYSAENMISLGALDSEGDTPMATEPAVTSIPDEAEVRRIKLARERKKAGESDFIPLDEDENDSDDYRSKKKKSSRLARPEVLDDDDPELQTYVQDGRLSLAPSTRKREAKLARLAIASQINDAEDDHFDHANSGTDTSASEDELLGWERDQIRAATGGKAAPELESIAKQSRTFTNLEDRLRYTPPNIRPLPSINLALGRLKGLLRNMEEERKKTLAKVEDVRRERTEIAAREEQVKKGLEESAREYERLEKELREMGLGVPGEGTVGTRSGTMTPLEGRGLESIGGTPVR